MVARGTGGLVGDDRAAEWISRVRLAVPMGPGGCLVQEKSDWRCRMGVAVATGGMGCRWGRVGKGARMKEKRRKPANASVPCTHSSYGVVDSRRCEEYKKTRR